MVLVLAAAVGISQQRERKALETAVEGRSNKETQISRC